MKFTAGAVLPVLLLAVAPVAAHAQQAAAFSFDVVPSATSERSLDLLQDPPSDKPELVMGRSGIFLGIVGMLGGAVIGSAMSQNGCEDGDDGCRSRYAFTGALAAGTLAVPLGVHIANKQQTGAGAFFKSLGASIVGGAALYYGMKAIPGEPIQIAPFLAAPVQMVTSVKIEMASGRKATP